MKPAKLLVGQNLIVFAIVIVGVWFATELYAAELGFQPEFGSPWFALLGLPVCRVVVLVRPLRAGDFQQGRRDRGFGRPCPLHRRDRRLALACSAEPVGHTYGSLRRATGQEIDAARCSAPQVSSSAGSAGSICAMIARAAVWQRMIMPDDSSIPIDNLLATDAAGYAVSRTKVNHNTWTLLKGNAMSMLLGVGRQLTFSSNHGNLVEAIRGATAESTDEACQRIVEKDLNIQPTITVRPGWPLRVIVHKDLVLRPYQEQG